MKFNILSLAAIMAGAGLVSCQTSISQACQQTLLQVVTSSDAQCLNPSGLSSFVLAGTNQSIVNPIDSWLKGFCPLQPCTNQSIAAIITNVTNGCSNDLAGLGISGQTSSVIASVQQYLPTVKKVLCLQDDSANQLCITETLTNIQNTTGPLSINSIPQAISNIVSSGNGLPKSAVCTNCVKASWNILQGIDGIPKGASSPLSALCGSSFVDGQNPSGISDLAATPSASKSSAAMAAVPLLSGSTLIGLTISALAAVMSSFALLA